jgi:hypothetical protein
MRPRTPRHIHGAFMGDPAFHRQTLHAPVVGGPMFRPVLLALAALTLGTAPVAAQTGANAAGVSGVAPRTAAPKPTAAAPVKPTMTGQLTNFTRGFMQVQTQYSANIVSETLAAALQRSRNTVRPDSKAIPDEVKRELIPFYPAELLENVRYTIGDTSQAGLAGFAIRNGKAAAVTLIDTIVFKDESYVSSLALWAHEMHHVQQYTDWGLSTFAARYAFGWNEVEAEAGARAKAYVAWYRERKGLD